MKGLERLYAERPSAVRVFFRPWWARFVRWVKGQPSVKQIRAELEEIAPGEAARFARLYDLGAFSYEEAHRIAGRWAARKNGRPATIRRVK